MPKIIENLRSELIKTGKSMLIEKGYKALTMREVASISNIALGTVYNYFSSKDEMVASIMMQDWTEVFSKQNSYTDTGSAIEGLRIIYEDIEEFSSIYRNVWKEYGSTSGLTNSRHLLLISQIHGNVKVILDKFKIKDNDNVSMFISETILASAVREDVTFETIEPFIKKLIN